MAMLPQHLALAAMQGSVAGLVWATFGGLMLHTTVRWFGGRGSLEELQAVIAWACVPRLILLSCWIVIIWQQLYGPILITWYALPIPLVAYTFLATLAIVWEGWIFAQGMAEVNGFSAWRGLASGLVALLLTILLLACLVLTLAFFVTQGEQRWQPPAPLLVSLLVGAAIVSGFIALRSGEGASHNVDVSERLASWRPARPLSVDDVALSRPRIERLLLPFWAQIRQVAGHFTPHQQMDKLQSDLVLAGRPRNLTVADFLGLRLFASALIGGGAILYAMIGGGGLIAWVTVFAGFLLGYNLPDSWLRRRIASRQKAIGRALPDALDMLSICVDSGLGFEAAILRVSQKWDNDLARELRYVVSEMRVGVGRADALHHLVDRTGVADITSFVAILVQADKLGLSIGPVLQSQSLQMRTRRRQRAEEAAQKAPVKMLMPLGLFILPATFLVSLGPAVPRFMTYVRRLNR